MDGDVREKVIVPEPAAPTPGETYDLHIKLAKEMQPYLKEAARLAALMEVIPKEANLVDLMNRFIEQGLAILKKQWLDRMGYK